MKRVLAHLVTMVALGAGVAVAAPASAAPAGTQDGFGVQAWWDCPPDRFCAWYLTDGNDSGGNNTPEFVGQTGAPDLTKFNLNDHVWSVKNRTGDLWCAYPDINYSDVNGPNAKPNPWPISQWQGNTSQYGMQNVISSVRKGACAP